MQDDPSTTPLTQTEESLQREISRLKEELHATASQLPRLRQLIEFSADALLLHGVEGEILDCNRRCAELLEIDRYEVYGMNIQDFFRISKGTLSDWLAQSPLDQREIIQATIEPQGGPRLIVDIHSTKFALEGRDLVVSSVHDISELVQRTKELDQTAAQLRETNEDLHLAVKHRDEAIRKLDQINEFASSLLARQPSSKHLDDVARELASTAGLAQCGIFLGTQSLLSRVGYFDDASCPTPLPASIGDEEASSPNLECELLASRTREGGGHRTGLHFAAAERLAGAPLFHDGTRLGLIVGLRTEEEPPDSAGWDIFRALIPLVSPHIYSWQATTKMRAALVEQRHYLEMRTRFVQTTSHEFRTPLSIISSASDLLAEHRNSLDDAQISKRVEKIRSAASRMTDLVANILDSTPGAGPSGQAVLTPVDIHECVAEFVSDQWEAALDSGRIHMSLPEPGRHWKLDLGRFYRIVNNLLSNALKFSAEKTQIALTVEVTRTELRLSVRDQGQGIPPTERAAIFERFHRGGNCESHPGVGLGLSIVKEAVDSQGGTIEVESTEGVGTTFLVRIPQR